MSNTLATRIGSHFVLLRYHLLRNAVTHPRATFVTSSLAFATGFGLMCFEQLGLCLRSNRPFCQLPILFCEETQTTALDLERSTPSKAPCSSPAHALPDPSIAPAPETEIEELLATHHVILFMKGSPDRPRCRYSRKAVEVLKSYGIQFQHIDILEQPALRKALKDRWPTFPQLYVEGVLLGGSSEVVDLAHRGELLDALQSSIARERLALGLLLKSMALEAETDQAMQ